MRPRQEAHFADDGPDGVEVAAIQAPALPQDQAADGFLLDVIEGVLEHELGHPLRAKLFDQLQAHFLREGRDRGFAGQFAGRQQRRDDAVAGQGFGFLEDFLGHDIERDLALGLADAGGQLFLHGNGRLNGLVAELERGVKVRLADFPGRPLIHDEVGFVADIDQVQVAFEHLAVGGVGDELAVDAAHADRAQRARPGDVADHEGGRGADDRQHVRVVVAVGAQDDALDLDFVVPAFGEERADGAVNEPRGEDFLFGGAAFAFEIAARELARRRGLFPVIHGQRKEILAGFGFGGGHGRDDDDGFPELDADRAVGLFGEFPRFDDELFVPHRGNDFL